MARFAAVSPSASLSPVTRLVRRQGVVIRIPWRGYACGSLSFPKSSRKGFCRVASSAAGPNNAAVESSETEKYVQYAWPDKKRPRICILGGGFGGLYTALRLESLVWPDDNKPQVLLVDQSERFVFKPMLYELLSGEVDEWEIAPRFLDLLANTSIDFFRDRVKLLQPSYGAPKNGSGIASSAGTVHLESGRLVEYDWLVLALGAESMIDSVPGATEHALPFSTLEDALRVNTKLNELERRNFRTGSPIRVVVVGCGYSGVELAATISDRLQSKGIIQAVNVATTICPSAPPGNREAALKVLTEKNVQLFLGYFVRAINKASDLGTSNQPAGKESVEDPDQERDPEKLILELQPAERGLQGQVLEADLILWTVGSKPHLPQLEPYELPLNARGQVESDETLRVKGHPRIFAVGDSSGLKDSAGRLLPATAQVAFQQADFAGWNLWAAINGRPLLPFRYQNLGEMMTLGRWDAAVSPSFIDGLTLEGPVGHAARKLAYLIRLPTDEHRIKVGISWFTKTAIDSVASLQTTLTKVVSGA